MANILVGAFKRKRPAKVLVIGHGHPQCLDNTNSLAMANIMLTLPKQPLFYRCYANSLHIVMQELSWIFLSYGDMLIRKKEKSRFSALPPISE